MMKDYWNNKHPKKSIIYAGRGVRGFDQRINIDVRNMVWGDDGMLQAITSNIYGSNDEKALIIQRYIVNNFKYVDDKTSSGLEECWMFPNESLVLKQGDCEDMSILMASLMLNAGIPNWRVRVTAGLVKAGKAAETGGHAYVTYCRETDNNWIILDWCLVDNKRTLISTPDGKSRISKLKVGDTVIGFDENLKIPALTTVEKIGNRVADNLYTVSFEFGENLTLTGEHPFYVNGAWKRTDELIVGDEVYWIKPQQLYANFHNHKGDPWRLESCRKATEQNYKTGHYKKLSERQKQNNVFTRLDVRKKLSENNCMHNPEIVKKSFSTRTAGKISGPEVLFSSYCKDNNLPVQFVGDGKYWIHTRKGVKNPDFHIPGTKKVIEVSTKQFEYFRNWEDYKNERTLLFQEKGYSVFFVLYDRKTMTCNTDELHEFVLNGNKVVNINKKNNSKTVWNLHCVPHNNYFVNGNLVHNCYLPDAHIDIKNKPIMRDKKEYLNVWFSFNDEYSWSHETYGVIEHL